METQTERLIFFGRQLTKLKGRILFTLAALAVFRLGSWIPVPSLDFQRIAGFFAQSTGVHNVPYSIFALGLTPYINATLLISLLAFRIHRLRAWFLSEETGANRIRFITLLVTLLLSLLQSYGTSSAIAAQELADPTRSSLQFYLVSIFALTAGAFLLIWLGGVITKYGLGNGWAILILADIVVRIPESLSRSLNDPVLVERARVLWGVGRPQLILGLGTLLLILLVFGGTLLALLGTRKIRIPQTQQAFAIPFLQVGIIPLYLPLTFLATAQTLLQGEAQAVIPDWARDLVTDFVGGGWLYLVFYSILILLFTYLYKNAVFHPQSLGQAAQAENDSSLAPDPPWIHNPALGAGLFLVVLALLPFILSNLATASFFFLGGSSMLIMVGVLIDLFQRVRPYAAVPKRQRSLRLTTVYRTFSHARAHWVSSQLERSGIKCVLQTLLPYPYLIYPWLGPVEIVVSTRQLNKAQEIIQTDPAKTQDEKLRVPCWEIAIWLLLGSALLLAVALAFLRVPDKVLWIVGSDSLILGITAGLFWILLRRGYREYAYWLVFFLLQLGVPLLFSYLTINWE